MRYENLITSNLVLFDLPKTKLDRKTKHNYFDAIFKRLLVMDQMPDDDLQAVITEASEVPGDPAFEITFRNQFEKFLQTEFSRSKWQKLSKDYNYFAVSEIKRRNKQNPYHPEKLDLQNLQSLPNLAKQKKGQGWQYSDLYKEIQILAGEAYELAGDKENQDKDLFRLKINSILAADKIIFALNNIENYQYHLEREINLINLKLSLDAFKLAFTYLNRSIESLHKIRWSAGERTKTIDKVIHHADKIIDILKNKIFDTEKTFVLFTRSDLQG